MMQKLLEDEADRRAREVAHRLLTSPPRPKAAKKTKAKPSVKATKGNLSISLGSFSDDLVSAIAEAGLAEHFLKLIRDSRLELTAGLVKSLPDGSRSTAVGTSQQIVRLSISRPLEGDLTDTTIKGRRS